jgi:hypothetical protein
LMPKGEWDIYLSIKCGTLDFYVFGTTTCNNFKFVCV